MDHGRIVRAQQASGRALKDFDRLQMCGGFPWCIASIPIPSWAKKVFPDLPEDQAMERLWEAIFRAVRISGDGRCVDQWHQHIETLARRVEKLNQLNFKALRYTNSLGTDLTVELPEGHIWEAGNDVTLAGQTYIANIPTEEVFTSPLKTGVSGVVYSALPPKPQRHHHRQVPLCGQGWEDRGGPRGAGGGGPQGRRHRGRGGQLLR